MEPTQDAESSDTRRLYLLILGLLALSFMLFQIAVLRELRYQLATVFTLTPFLFSTVLRVLGLGSLAAGRIGPRSQRVLAWIVALLPIIIVPLFANVIAIPRLMFGDAAAAFMPGSPGGDALAGLTPDGYLGRVILAFVVVEAVGYGPIFFLQGAVFAMYFERAREQGSLSNVYAVDLAASGLGALVGGLLCFALTPIQMVLAAALTLLATLLISSRFLAVDRRLVAAATILTLAFVGGELRFGVLDRLEVQPWLTDGLVHSRWSRYRRIDVVEREDNISVYADKLPFQAISKDTSTYRRDPRVLPAAIAAGSPQVHDVLLLGSGTGTDIRIFREIVPRELRIVAVEIDSGFIAASQAVPWLWESYQSAEIVAQEGRYFLENDPEQFDLIVFSYIDPQSAVSNVGLPDASFMYTDAGLRRAYAKLRDGGFFVLSRVFFVSEEEEFMRRLRATLNAAGIPREEFGIYRAGHEVPWGYYGELSMVYVLARKGERAPVLNLSNAQPVTSTDLGRPTTDRFPISMATGVWFSTLVDFVRHRALALTLVAIAVLALALRMATSAAHTTFFLLGFGSFLLESLVLFYSFLLLGDPSLSAAVAIGVFLLWNALGSLLAERFARWRPFLFVVPVAVAVYAVTAPSLNGATIGSPIIVRALAFSLHLAIGGIVGGAMFPLAVRRFREHKVSRMFAIDLIGAAIAPVAFWLSLSLGGVEIVAIGAVLSYALVGLLLTRGS